MRYCTACGCPRDHTDGICPDCGSPEFDCSPNPTYAGWLEREMVRLRGLNESLVSRMAAMCEVLCRKANRLPAECPHCGGEIEIGEQPAARAAGE